MGDSGGLELRTKRLILRRWTEADADALHAAFGDPETMRFWDSPPTRDAGDTAARIRQSLDVDPTWHAAYTAVLRDTGALVGMVNYHDRRPAHRRLAIGWILVPRWRRLGLAHEAAQCLMRYSFTDLQANRIEARIHLGNAASFRLAGRLGFRQEGLLHEWMFVNGTPRDIVLLAALRKDWRPDLLAVS